MSHTRGPWLIRSRHETDGAVSGVSRFVDLPNGVSIRVAWVVNPTREQDEEARANTRLIAASPDLLDAAMALLGAKNDAATVAATLQLRAAVQKATVPQS